MGRFWDRFLEAMFPRFCVGCKATGALVCAACAADVALSPVMVDGVFSLFSYREPLVRAAVQAHKYHGDLSGVQALVGRTDVHREIHALMRGRDVVFVPMPLHDLRERARGFNQAADIASLVAAEVGGVVMPLLARVAVAAQLAGKSREERLTAMSQQPFVVTTPEEVVGKRVIVVDDVRTTGATMHAALAALRAAGIDDVIGLTFAAADHDGDI